MDKSAQGLVGPPATSDDCSELVDGFGVLSSGRVSQRPVIKDRRIRKLHDRRKQIHSLCHVSSLALDDGSNQGQINLLVQGFDRLPPIGLAGTLTGSDISLTSTPVEGQVITLAGTITVNPANDVDTFTGNYTINGGCASGDTGTVTGILIYIEVALDGTFTSSGNQTFGVSGGLNQNGTPNLDGSFGLTGTATLDTPCFTSVTIKPGTLSSGSFIMGTAVGLEFDTNNGTVTFQGTLDLNSYDLEFDSYLIAGNYTVSGGACDGTGTAVLRV